MEKILVSQKIAVLKQLGLTKEQKLSPFAVTDALLAYTEATGESVLHFWSMEKMLIFGMQDRRLSQFKQGLAKINAADYHGVVRNSGGLAVASDAGVLNISCIVKQPPQHKASITTGYESMLDWIRQTFCPENPGLIKAYEIDHSYCPGSFDLSIHQQKFAGMAQRRVKNSVALMLYLSIDGDQRRRGELVQAFYQAAATTNELAAGHYPQVWPEVMNNLSALLDRTLTVDSVIQQLSASFQDFFDCQTDSTQLIHYLKTAKNQAELEKYTEKIRIRNQGLPL